MRQGAEGRTSLHATGIAPRAAGAPNFLLSHPEN